jgi:hypothetical protein
VRGFWSTMSSQVIIQVLNLVFAMGMLSKSTYLINSPVSEGTYRDACQTRRLDEPNPSEAAQALAHTPTLLVTSSPI